jgi:hypothetical protein
MRFSAMRLTSPLGTRGACAIIGAWFDAFGRHVQQIRTDRMGAGECRAVDHGGNRRLANSAGRPPCRSAAMGSGEGWRNSLTLPALTAAI